MGMHVWYELESAANTLSAARDSILRLHARAQSLPFEDVSPVLSVATQIEPSGIFAGKSVEVPGSSRGRFRLLRYKPLEGVGFIVHPGDGCESASFGLARYPAAVRDDETGQWHATGTDAYRWRNGCKTQYAFRYGREHFLRCHISLVDLLDAARNLDLVRRVSDEGGFWEKRDIDKLLARRQEHDEIVAAVVGPIVDAFRDAGVGGIVAPVTADPAFEHLEHRGSERLRNLKRD